MNTTVANIYALPIATTIVLVSTGVESASGTFVMSEKSASYGYAMNAKRAGNANTIPITAILSAAMTTIVDRDGSRARSKAGTATICLLDRPRRQPTRSITTDSYKVELNLGNCS